MVEPKESWDLVGPGLAQDAAVVRGASAETDRDSDRIP
jgi:hypothetical protein